MFAVQSLFLLLNIRFGFDRFFLDTLAIPTLATGLSCVIWLLQVLFSTFANRKQQVATYESGPGQNIYQLDASKSYRNIVESNGGASIFTFKTLRLISCLTLLVTSLYTTRSNWHVPTDSSSILHLGLSITFVCMSIPFTSSIGNIITNRLIPYSWPS